ncbi:MAG: cytochrome c oxidase subunit II [Alphaproteobacteria bacterium]|nr:cytochrome c oxidase subunit II [Alphaproteobacteria bacterium]
MASTAAPARNDYSVSPNEGWDTLWNTVLLDITVIGVVFGFAALYMLFKYKASGPGQIGKLPKLSRAQAWGFALLPAAVFMADDFYLSAKGWTLWNIYRRVPENALEVKLVARQWQWEFDYGQGVKTDTLVVPQGQPVVLRMTAEDVIHSYFIPHFRVKEDVMPGRVTYLWFMPKDLGTFVSVCTEFCGTGHSNMPADVKVVPPGEFQAWFASNRQAAAPAPAAAPAADPAAPAAAPAANPS